MAHSLGWMTTNLFEESLRHFVKFIKVSKNNPAVLLMDILIILVTTDLRLLKPLRQWINFAYFSAKVQPQTSTPRRKSLFAIQALLLVSM